MKSERRKTLRTIGLFALILLLIGTPCAVVFLYSENHTYQDFRERDEVAGTIGYVEIGASHCKRGFVPAIVDEGLGVDSYNLGGESMTMQGRLELLKVEMARNPVETVILELSMDSMNSNPGKELGVGDLYLVPRLGKISLSVPYLLKIARPQYLGRIFTYFLTTGIDDVRTLFDGTYTLRSSNQRKGYVPHADNYVKAKQLSLKKLKKYFQSRERTIELREQNEAYLRQIMELCKEQGAEVVFVTVPVTSFWIARYSNLDVACHYYQQIAAEYGVDYYDFNLWKGEYDRFRDGVDFYDNGHLSNEGAENFTNLFVEVMQRRAAGEDVAEEFYADYAELYQHVPYGQTD